ncbi:TetR/AcrR family transcriptional regulator [Arthrobacter sp. ISL-72]|uniref:TetR/AcrR family transcriptional regulator n=1 Tax=Arthrobacter sp. ISL-72 TaxID=2819114 RepID=UPI001BE9D2CD|nr:TetR/AcrR family transcriptional regulator [Arthrobacter sp. ISL-72]MBT2596127.1 TetR/AcrR family transcriptional regulator [Arthrobacter sp. ISL-72]
MPKLWNETIEAHRSAVRDAILDAAMTLVSKHGPLSVTMSQVAKEVGIGRATLYKYFPDVEGILLAVHDRQVAGQLEHLHAVRDAGGNPARQLEQILRIHAMMVHEHHGSAISSVMHQGSARKHQLAFLQDILQRSADSGVVRSDISSEELAKFCLHALSAAAEESSRAAVDRLVQLTLDSLRIH